MLSILRRKGLAKKISWVIAVVIIISFGFFGTAYLLNDGSQNDYAGKIFGKKVNFEEFRRVYHSTDIQAMLSYGTNYKNFKQFLNLENQAWDRLILLYEARKRRIQIPDKQVVQVIESFPFFQRDGQFDSLLYNDILRYAFKITARNFEEGIRDNLKIQEILKRETGGVSVSDEEIFEEYKKRNEKAQVSYVFISPTLFKDQAAVSDDELQQYYHQHKHEFLVPPTISVDYLSFDFPEIVPTAKPVSTESAGETAPPAEPVEAMKPDEQAVEAIRQKADGVYKELLANPDIQDVAQKNNLELKNTGFFSMEQPVLTLGWSYELINKIFQLDVRQVSGPFETAKGILIPQVREKRDAYVPEYAEVQDKVRQTVLEKKARDIAGIKAKETLGAIRQKFNDSGLDNFSETAKGLGLDLHQTPVFARGQYLPQIGISNEFQEAAFHLTEQEKISGVVETPTGFSILHLDSYVPVVKENFDAEKAKMADELLQEKRNIVFGDFLDKLRLKAGLVNNIPTPSGQ